MVPFGQVAGHRFAFRLLKTLPSRFSARVKIEKRRDNYQENNLPKDEHRWFEPAEVVMRVHIDDERAEGNACDEPDDLTLGIPHSRLVLGALNFVLCKEYQS